MRYSVLFSVLLVSPLVVCAEESSALRQTVGAIEDYCRSIDGELSSLNSYAVDALGELSDIAISASFTQNQLRTFYTNFVAFANSELDYSEGSYYLLQSCDTYLLNIQDELSNNIYPLFQSIGVDLSSLLSSFTSLRFEFSSYSTQVLSALASIDSNVEQILGAITNRAASVVYDFSVLTNSFGRSSGLLLEVRGPTWANVLDLNSLALTTTPTANISSSTVLAKSDLASFLRQLFYDSYASIFIERNIMKSAVIGAFSSVSISNNVGRLVLQGDYLTNRVDSISKNTFWISNYLDSVLTVTQKQLTNDTARMLVILEQLTNQQFSVDVQQKEEIQKGVDYSTETADSIEKPDDFTWPQVAGLQFDLSNVKSFVDGIPTYDTMPMFITVSYNDKDGAPIQWQAEVAPYGAVCTAIRAISSVLIYGVVLTLVIVGVKYIFRYLRFVAELIPSVDKV